MNDTYIFRRIRGRIVRIRKKHPDAVRAVAAATSAVATYGFLRKFKLSRHLPLAKLQSVVRRSGVSLTSHLRDPKWRKVQAALYGFQVNKPTGIRMNTFMTTAHGSKGVVNSAAVSGLLDDKLNFGKIFKNFTPKTWSAKQVLARKTIRNPANIIFKPRDGSLGKLADFATGEDILRKTEKGMRVLNNPIGFIGQEKLKLVNEYRAHTINGKVFGISYRRIPNERARGFWNRFTTKMGLGDGGGAFIPVVNPRKRKQIKAFLKEATFKSGMNTGLPKGESFFAAFDIGDTGKGLKLIEANSSPGSFVNPVVSRQLHRQVTGRWSRDVAGVAAAGAGGVTFRGLKKQEAAHGK